MRHVITTYVFLLAIATSACAQTAPPHEDIGSGSDQGTVACWNEKSMVTLMKTMSPKMVLDKNVLNRLIKSGDCLVMPDGWGMLQAIDPPLDQQDSHASQWTVRTPKGIVHMWGMPFGGD